LLVLVVVLLLRLPFLNQAIQGDDIYYLAGAQHAQIEPLHPNRARYAFLGEMVSMQGHPHPPLNAWWLAGLLALTGDIEERTYHAAYLLFSLLAAASMWSLARRFTKRPLAATLLVLATPAFVVNGNSLEADLPLLAFWLAATALFVRAVDQHSLRWLAAAAVMMAAAALAAYQAVVLIPILALFLWLHARRWRPAWIVLLTPAATLVAWQLFELLSTGSLPASVLAGFFETYGLQSLSRKLTNAAALTAHLAWVVFPPLAVAAFGAGRKALIATSLIGAGAAWLDAHPVFWASFGVGVLILTHWARSVRSAIRSYCPEELFLAGWGLLFFAAALALFFAGSARYLLPIAAPAAILASRRMANRPAWLAAGFACQLALSLAMARVNYEHWDGYRRFAQALAPEAANARVWINGEWGLRYYLESEGGLPLLRGQAVRPGDIVVSSRLAYPVPFTTGGGVPTLLREHAIRTSLPLRLIGLNARSAYSTAAFGLRPFDLSRAPVDVVRADLIVEHPPALERLPMNAPEAERQIVSGLYQLEENRFRWTGRRATVLLKRPPLPAPLYAVLYVPDAAPARRISIAVDGAELGEQVVAGPGLHTVVTRPVPAGSPVASVTVTVDRTFRVPGDHRELGVILSEIGFQPGSTARPSP